MRLADLSTQTVTISGTTPVTISNPYTDKKPVCWMVWKNNVGAVSSLTVSFDSTPFLYPASIGATFIGMCGPFIGEAGDDLVFESVDATADAEFTVTYGWVNS